MHHVLSTLREMRGILLENSLLDETIEEKADEAIAWARTNLGDDGHEDVEFDIDADTLHRAMLFAHGHNMTLTGALSHFIEMAIAEAEDNDRDE